MPGTKAGATKSTWVAHLKQCAKEWHDNKDTKSDHKEATTEPKSLKGKAAKAVKTEVTKARKVAKKTASAANVGHNEAQKFKRQKTADEKQAFRKRVAATRKPPDTDATARALTRTLQEVRDKSQAATERAIDGTRRIRITSKQPG